MWKYCHNLGIESIICIPGKNVNAPSTFQITLYLMNKLFLSINWKIIKRIYIVVLLIIRVNIVSVLSTLEKLYSHFSFIPLKGNEIMIYSKTLISINLKFIHLINQNKFQSVFDPPLHSSQTAKQVSMWRHFY